MRISVTLSNLLLYIPLVATMVTTVLSIILAKATLRYTAATDKGLALAREEFEREWSPELHIKLERLSSTDARIIVTNLAKTSVLLQMVQVRKVTHVVPSERIFLNEPLVGGMTWTEGFRKRLLVATGEKFQGPIAVAITFYASGRMFRTDWFRFQVQIKDGDIVQIDPVNIAARRVRVIESKDAEGRVRRDYVRDVTGAAVRPSSEGVPTSQGNA